MKRILRLLIIWVPILFFGCEKAVNFKLDNVSSKLVIEATIENDQPPAVILSNSLSYFSAISPDILANSFVHNADVYISNGTLTHKLKEYAVPLGNGYSLYYYSIDSSNLLTAFKGELDHTYSLRVVANGKEYTSLTTIPKITKRIDSLYWKPAPALEDSNKVSLVVKATDPPGYGDYIRYFTKRNSEPFYPGINSVFDDQIIDGSTYELEVERGWNRNTDPGDRSPYFIRGDTITLKLCNIDKATFDFWRT
ncbi:MAG: DUF4249 domain-containing protein, partial [Bacteroidetes bacterium]|nr:DUF4249 domain-containing protein [Bacteroidota bacterium]